MTNREKPTKADILYDGFYSGAISASVVALCMLAIDALNGRPLFTPSLMGSVLFEGAQAASVSGVRLDMVAYYSIVHFAIFAALGFTVSFLVHEVEIHTRHPAEVFGLLFVVFEGGFFIGAYLLLPGVTEVVGAARLLVVNLVAAASMGLFLLGSHRPGLWRRWVQDLVAEKD